MLPLSIGDINFIEKNAHKKQSLNDDKDIRSSEREKETFSHTSSAKLH